MSKTIPVTGKVKYSITLDPGVWILDDRKIDLLTYFDEQQSQTDDLEEYTKAVASHFSREIQEGATYPPTLKTERKFEKQKMLTGTFGIPLKPFLENAEPLAEAGTLTIETLNGSVSYPLDKALTFILAFSYEGKPLTENGPVHILFNDGSNRLDPITDVRQFVLS
ncbi:peptidyl-prolyl cis-trans isomerase [Jeotgalibacillus sp. ET6]|uniref:peptidyl-prolyl cis-trans isomerase n=1 Tax=Jeotgalibacillus sp. ET6 TaxID=3037260 RepID=UPI0024187E1B|nr:peptidyl-prolyl cis-trans isomerase [Jeotgalibacillus sp. ET6]MDG5470156.1 peptidyl-prolyl cis-trans isomerase [Jeotgalibacillus sp. ET6]